MPDNTYLWDVNGRQRIDSNGIKQTDIPELPYQNEVTWRIGARENNAGTVTAKDLSECVSWVASVGTDFVHDLISGATTGAYSGAVTSIRADGFSTTPPAAGILHLTNGSDETEEVAYTSYISNGTGDYTFTVAATLTYTYAENDTVQFEKTPPSTRTLNANIDSSDKANGNVDALLDTDKITFSNDLNGEESKDAWFELSGFNVSGVRKFYCRFKIKLKNIVDPVGTGTPPGPPSLFPTWPETDAKYLRSDLDGEYTEQTSPASGDMLPIKRAATGNIEYIQMTNLPSGSPPDLSVTAAKLASNAVETDKIKDANVTTAKLADAAVETAKLEATERMTKANIESVLTGEISSHSHSAAQLELDHGINTPASELEYDDNTKVVIAVIDETNATNTPPATVSLLCHWNNNVTDRSDQAHTVTLNGGLTYSTTALWGKSLDFDGSDDSASIPDHATLQLGSQFLISQPVRFGTGSLSAIRTIISKESADTSAKEYRLEWDPARGLVFYWANDAGDWEGEESIWWLPTVETWYKLCVGYASGTIYFFVNGTLVGSAERTISLYAGSNPVWIGMSQATGAANPFLGQMDESLLIKGDWSAYLDVDDPSAQSAEWHVTKKYDIVNAAVATINPGTVTGQFAYWDGSAWGPCDNTKLLWDNSGGKLTLNALLLSGLTASQIVETDASKNLISAAKGTAYNKSFGTGAGNVCQGNDSRLSDARTPTSHAHGNITNDGKIGSTSGLPLITTTAGAVTVGSFGSSAGTFCAGDDSRLSNSRTPTAHNLVDTTGHPVSGLTSGHVLKASGATTYGFAALAWSEVNKSTSSLADITTRSAGDLSSGNLAVARMPTGGTWELSSELKVTSSQSDKSVLFPTSKQIQTTKADDAMFLITSNSDFGGATSGFLFITSRAGAGVDGNWAMFAFSTHISGTAFMTLIDSGGDVSFEASTSYLNGASGTDGVITCSANSSGGSAWYLQFENRSGETRTFSAQVIALSL